MNTSPPRGWPFQEIFERLMDFLPSSPSLFYKKKKTTKNWHPDPDKMIILRHKSAMTTLSCDELTHWKRLWCWEGLGTGGEGDDRGWDGWMASPTRWMWVWMNSRSWWWTGRPGMLQFMGLQRVRHNWMTELSLPPSWSAGFLNKVVIHCLNTLSPDLLACPVASRASVNLVTCKPLLLSLLLVL